MKYYSKILSSLLCIALLFHVTACSREPENTAETASKKEAAAYQIGICQFHNDYYSQKLIQGFQDALHIKLKSDNITFVKKEVDGDTAALASACSELDSGGFNLIFLDSQGDTASLDTNAYKTKILSTPELPVIEQAEDTLLELLPDTTQLGIFYNNTDPSSLTRAEEVKKNLDADGIKYREYTANDYDSLEENANHISDECDSLYIVTSDLMLEHIAKLEDTFVPAGIPAIADSEELCRLSIASVSVPAYDFGTQLGNIAAEYILNNTEPNTTNLDTSELIKKYYNSTICEDFEIKVTDDLTAMP